MCKTKSQMGQEDLVFALVFTAATQRFHSHRHWWLERCYFSFFVPFSSADSSEGLTIHHIYDVPRVQENQGLQRS